MLSSKTFPYYCCSCIIEPVSTLHLGWPRVIWKQNRERAASGAVCGAEINSGYYATCGPYQLLLLINLKKGLGLAVENLKPFRTIMLLCGQDMKHDVWLLVTCSLFSTVCISVLMWLVGCIPLITALHETFIRLRKKYNLTVDSKT